VAEVELFDPEQRVRTVWGTYVKRKNLEKRGLFECELCGEATVAEDEIFCCPDCEEQTLCLYCYEAGMCPCRQQANAAAGRETAAGGRDASSND